MKKVLFVCTGNYYRSRFAEALFNFHKGDALSDWRAESRGLMIETAPLSISPHTREAIQRRGIPEDCYSRVPVALTHDDLVAADMVIALKEEEHRPMMRAKFPSWEHQIRYLEVHDLDVWESGQTLPSIEIQVGLLIEELREPS